MESDRAMLQICRQELPEHSYLQLHNEIEAMRSQVQKRTAWRIEGTLREFPRFAPVNLWFEFPVHIADSTGILQDAAPNNGYTGRGSPWAKNFDRKKSKEELKNDRRKALNMAFQACQVNGEANISDLSEYLGKSEDTVRRHIKESGKYWVDEGIVGER